MEIKLGVSESLVAKYLADSILSQLQKGKKVLWFVTGGSSIPLSVLVSRILKEESHENLVVMLTDERYGEVGHKDSNWQKLLDMGFSLPNANLIPILMGKSIEDTVNQYVQNLSVNFSQADFKIGLFGAGTDMHTAGILPKTVATVSENLAVGYHTDMFDRVTMTFNAIKKLDKVILNLKGENKLPVIEGLKKDSDKNEEPVQVLKEVRDFTVFSDFVV